MTLVNMSAVSVPYPPDVVVQYILPSSINRHVVTLSLRVERVIEEVELTL